MFGIVKYKNSTPMAKKPISSNFYRGSLIKTEIELRCLADSHKSVYHSRWGIKPAAVILNLPRKTVQGIIDDQLIYYITK